MALFGANADMASMCEVYCAGVDKGNSDHHHQTAARLPSSHQHMHAQQHAADCPECPKSAREASLQHPDCGNFTQVQALQENSRIFSDDHASFQLGITKSSTGFLLAPMERERFSPVHSPPNISIFQPALVSLRI